VERIASVAGGAALAAFGVSRRTPAGLTLAMTSGIFMYRGIRGRDPLYKLLGINTAKGTAGPRASVRHLEGIKVERAVTIERPAAELFQFWRNFSNLPRFMQHLEAVEVLDARRSHWIARAPAGRTVAWDAEILTEQPNELIGWRSLPGADVPNAGSVRFKPAPGDRGTEVHVSLEYDAPGGSAGVLVARLFGEEPDLQVREDLRRFKQIMEAGEVATTEGQPSGR
jgi:uncharacterized membrane protein